MDCCLGGLRSGSRWNGTYGIKGCMASMLRVRVSSQCNRCMGMDSHQKEAWHLSFVPSVLCMLFVFPVTILVLPGISSDISDGFLIAWLMGSGSFLFDPAIPWPIHGLSNFPCLGKTCCFSGVKFRSKLFCTPWTSGSFVPLVLACEQV